jgi:hypothetical protein
MPNWALYLILVVAALATDYAIVAAGWRVLH